MAEGAEAPCSSALRRLHEAVTELQAAVDDGGVDHLAADAKVAFWHELERARRRLPVVEHAMVVDAERYDLAGHLGFASLTTFLVRTLALSPGEAAARVRAAGALGTRTTMTGGVLDPVRPALAAAQRGGEVSAEQVDIVVRSLDELSATVPAERVDEAEDLLVEQARVFGPTELRRIGRRLVEIGDPDGPPPDESVQHERRHLEVRRLRDGMYRVEGRLTAVVGAQLHALLTPLARPRPSRVENAAEEAAGGGEGGGPSQSRRTDGVVSGDPRHHGQRCHDALEELCARLLRTAEQGPDAALVGGVPATVLVSLTLDDLRSGGGTARTSTGAPLTGEQLLQLAAEAEVWTVLTDARHAPLALGRTRRLASRAQALALAARDGGCSFPGCDRPPEWCDRHHVLDWIRGGPTDVDNLTLLCRWHHTHFAQRGWTVAMNDDRLPEWTPPRWVDPQQRPLLHERIRCRRVEHALIA